MQNINSRLSLVCAMALSTGMVFNAAHAQDEVGAGTLFGDMYTVTQDMLDHAEGDSNNWLHRRRQLRVRSM